MESFTRTKQWFGYWVTFIIANLFGLKLASILGIVLLPLDGELSLRTKSINIKIMEEWFTGGVLASLVLSIC